MISRITFCSAQPAMMRAALWPDPGDLTQAIGLLLDDVEHGFPEGAHELLRINRPNATNHAGAEIFLDPLDCRRCRSLEERGAKLDAMRAVIGPRPARLDELAGRDHRGMADYGDEIALAAGFDPQHAKAVLGVVERDPDRPAQPRLRSACLFLVLPASGYDGEHGPGTLSRSSHRRYVALPAVSTLFRWAVAASLLRFM